MQIVRTTVLLACLLGLASTAQAQITRVTYSLDDIWLLPDVSNPGAAAQQLSGSFEWIYTVGDFENGTGAIVDLDIPWFSLGLEWVNATFDSGSIDTTRSSFDIQNTGISHKGHAISGSIVPGPPVSGCVTDQHCDDGLFCNGTEACVLGTCETGLDACPGEVCDETRDQCMPIGGCGP